MERQEAQPLGLRILGWLLLGLLATWIAVALSRHWLAPRSPSPTHPYGVKFKGSKVFYFPEPLGLFMDYFIWIFVLICVAGAAWSLVLRYRARTSG
jgi:hypothetical protein